MSIIKVIHFAFTVLICLPFQILCELNTNEEWKLVWNDEFNESSLNTQKWELENESNGCHGWD